MTDNTDPAPFGALRPRLLVLMEQYRTETCDKQRARLAGCLEELFLATAWHVAKDMLDHGLGPGFLGSLTPTPARDPAPAAPPPRYRGLRVVGGTDAA